MLRRNRVKTAQTLRLSLFRASAVLAVLAVTLGSCSKDDTNRSSGSRMEMVVTSTLGQSTVIPSGQAANATRAIVSGLVELDFYFARADETSAGVYGAYGATALMATRAAGTGTQPLTFNPLQYYRADGLKSKLTGWYPGGATAVADAVGRGYYNGTTHSVSWTINGQQDILTTALAQEGNSMSVMPSLEFKHRLSQLKFCPYAETQSAIDAWGKITQIEVFDQRNKAVYSLVGNATGEVVFQGLPTASFSAGIPSEGVQIPLSSGIQNNVVPVGNPVMIEEQLDANYQLIVRITTDKNKSKTLALIQPFKAGVPYNLYLNFKELDVSIESGITQWGDVNTDDILGEGNVRIGDFLNGGIVYWVDGANYKVVSVTEWPGKVWAASFNSVFGSGAQSDTDGRANSAAIKAYFDANKGGTVTQSTFEAAFPAAAECYNYTGKDGNDPKGAWYLPAKREVEYLWCGYNGKAPGSSTDAPPPDDPAAQTAFNKYLTDAGGTGIGTFYWSSNEDNNNGPQGEGACYVPFWENGGDVRVAGKDYTSCNVRCVKHIAPPPVVGDLRDGGLVYQVMSSTDYKVVSAVCKDGGPFAAFDSYVLGTTNAYNPTDGRKNMAAVKAYFAANTATVGSDFSAAFPAAAFCDAMNKDGVTGWCLPAVNELQELFLVFEQKPHLIESILSNSGLQDTDCDFWTGTEVGSELPGKVWSIGQFAVVEGGSRRYNKKTNSNGMRTLCIRRH